MYSCHPRAGGGLVVQQDSRFRGNDKQILTLGFDLSFELCHLKFNYQIINLTL